MGELTSKGSHSNELLVMFDLESRQTRLANLGELFPRGFCPKTTIRVVVGTESEPFIIHKDILCASSNFFKNSFNKKPWRESAELQTTNPHLFEIYARWLYAPDPTISMKKPILVTAADGAKSVPAYEPLFNLYALGHMLQDSNFKDAVLNKIVEVAYAVNYFPICYSAFVYRELPPSSPLRRLYVDFWVFVSGNTWFDTKNPADDCNSPEAPMEFFRDVLKRSKNGGDYRRPWREDICQYHEHTHGTKCPPLAIDQKRSG